MGITNAAPTFQKNMEIMLHGLLGKCCIVYIDDIIIFSDTFEDHLRHIKGSDGKTKISEYGCQTSKV